MAGAHYTKEFINRTYLAFAECRTAEGAAAIMNVPSPTVRKWRVKYKWDEKLEADKEKLAENPFEINTQLEKYVAGFDVPAEDATVLRQIKTVEGVCFACMRAEVPKEDIALQPRSFKEATDVLEKCWKAREALLHRDKKPSITVNGPAKMNFFPDEKNADITDQR